MTAEMWGMSFIHLEVGNTRKGLRAPGLIGDFKS